ncbi:MAG: preprotein translocase subunit SecY [Gammaproteobacteria bacterium]|nr:preprotein translocase subunit SecY [Gammaproteobacteria bacterium]
METIKKVFKNKEEMLKILFTLGIFLVYKICTMIPAVDGVQLFASSDASGFIGIINSFTGDALRNYSIVALGIGPYITASIIVELLEMDIIPTLAEWREEGEEGRKKLSQLTRYLGIVIALIQSIAMTFGMSSTIFQYGRTSFLGLFAVSITLTAGAAFTIWLADLITQFGVGNGTSLLITIGIVISFPENIKTLISDITGESVKWNAYVSAGLSLLFFFVILIGIVFLEGSQRKIQIQYANRPSSAKFQGASDSTFPIKLNSASVIPVIFAATLMGIPLTIIGYVGMNQSGGAYMWLSQIFSSSAVLGYVIYVLLIFFFAVFYTFLQINPQKTAEDLQQRGAYIPGIRPGYDTEQYLTKVIFNTTLVGAIYLVVVASLPSIASMLGASSAIEIGGTSMMIVVGVAIETARQIATDVQDQKYEGFLK